MDFKFENLGKPISKKKLHYIDPDLLSKQEMLSLANEISHSSISNSSDSNFDNGLQLSQYSIQYIGHCCSVLRKRREKVRSALSTYAEEDKQLDLKLTKLK